MSGANSGLFEGYSSNEGYYGEMLEATLMRPGAITDYPQRSLELWQQNQQQQQQQQQQQPSVVLATAGYDHTIRFWEVISGTCLGLIQHNESVSTLSVLIVS